MKPIGVNQRMPGCRNDLDVFEAGAAQAVGDELRRPLDVGFMLRQSADTWDPEEFFQLIQEPVFIFLDERIDGWH
jgi:hypothetical protein